MDQGKSLLLFIYYVKIIDSKILWNVCLWLICEIMIEHTCGIRAMLLEFYHPPLLIIFPILW